jgi:hypothetical protein
MTYVILTSVRLHVNSSTYIKLHAHCLVNVIQVKVLTTTFTPHGRNHYVYRLLTETT